MGKFGFSFSWRRALGLSAAKARLSRAIGVPLTRAGQERKLGRAMMGRTGALPLLLLGGGSGLLGCFGSIVRLAILIVLIVAGVAIYRHVSANRAETKNPAATQKSEKPADPEPTFEDILKQHQ